MEAAVLRHIEHLGSWAYVVLFFGLLFEGETFLFVAFYLVHQGNLSLTATLLTSFGGVLAGDLFWYWVGHHLNRVAFVRNKLERVSGPIDRQLLKRPMRTLFISKFAYGLHRLTQIRSGALRIDWKTFWEADIPAVILWIGTIAVLGSLASVSVEVAHHYMKFAQLGLLLGIILMWLVVRLIGHINRRQLGIEGDELDITENILEGKEMKD